MTTPPPRSSGGGAHRRTTSGSRGERDRATRERNSYRSRERNVHFHFGGGGGGGDQAPRDGGAGGERSRGPGGIGSRQRSHSPLADPEFFTNADIRNYCDTARQGFLQLSFELSMAAEVLQAVLKEVPDPDGRAFGSQMRARRVAKHLRKVADDAKDAAKNSARTLRRLPARVLPELEVTAHRRPRQTRRKFDFGG